MSVSSKIVEGLTQLFEGYVELMTGLEKDFAADADEDEDLRIEIDAALITEVRAAIEATMDREDISSVECASLVSVMVDALEEIDPDAFAEFDEEEDEERMPF